MSLDPDSSTDPYEYHFGATPPDLTEAKRNAVENKSFRLSRIQHGKLGAAVAYVPDVDPASAGPSKVQATVSSSSPTLYAKLIRT